MVAANEITCKQTSDGVFLVNSTSNSGSKYTVAFGTPSTMPSCTCPDWQRNKWPCKHFIAIFNTFPEWGWNALPQQYRNNPIFCIDEECFPSPSSPLPTTSQISSNKENEKTNTSLRTAISKTPVVSAQKSRKNCQAILKELMDLTYLCSDDAVLDKLQIELTKLKHATKEQITTEHGLIVRQTPTASNMSCKRPLAQKYKKLPLRKRKKPNTSKLRSQIDEISEHIKGIPESWIKAEEPANAEQKIEGDNIQVNPVHKSDAGNSGYDVHIQNLCQVKQDPITSTNDCYHK